MLSGLVPSTVFKKNLWAFLGFCVRGRGCPWYGTSAQPESHFTCSSPRGAPWVVPSTSLLNYFWAFLVALGRGEGAPLVRYLCETQKSLHGRHVWETLIKYLLFRDQKKTWQPETWQDSTLFSPPGNQAIFSTFWGGFLTKLHSMPRKGKKSTGETSENSSRDGLSRGGGIIAELCPLSWSNAPDY